MKWVALSSSGLHKFWVICHTGNGKSSRELHDTQRCMLLFNKPDVILIIQNLRCILVSFKNTVIVHRISLCSAAAQIKVKRSWRSSDRQSVFEQFLRRERNSCDPPENITIKHNTTPALTSGPVKHPTVRSFRTVNMSTRVCVFQTSLLIWSLIKLNTVRLTRGTDGEWARELYLHCALLRI